MLRVYNRFLDLLTIVDRFQSLQFPRNFHGVGRFEIHINRHMHGAEHLQKGNIIAITNNENKTLGNKVGLIQSRSIALDEGGKATEDIKLTGYTLDGLMERRMIIPPNHTSHDRKSGNAESVMKHYVYNHFVNPTDISRRYDMIEVAPNKNRGPHIEWESRLTKTVADDLEEISKQSGLGWCVYADFKAKKFIFDCVESKDLRQKNTVGNNPVVFSPDFGTVKSQSLLDSDEELKTVAYIGGQGEGVERKIIQVGEATGWDRIETFIDARDVSDEDEETGEKLTGEEVEKLLIDRGNKKMKEMQTILSFEAEILTPITRKTYGDNHEGYRYPAQPSSKRVMKEQIITPFQYEKDFNIGDTVDIVNKSWGIITSAPIIEFMEIYEQDGFKLVATFGDSIPTITSKLNSKFDEIENIEKQELPYQIQKEVIENIGNRRGELWMGATYPLESDIIKPTKPLDKCLNGWEITWSYSTPGAGADDRRFSYSRIPKTLLSRGEGLSLSILVPVTNTSNIAQKFLFVYKNHFIGHELNNSGDNARAVIRAVHEY